MTEYRLFPEGTVPEFTTREWYAGRDRAPHLEQHENGHRARLMEALSQARALLGVPGIDTLVDLGCGDGGLLSLIPALGDFRCWGYDLCPANVQAARAERGADVMLLDMAAHPDVIRWADLAVCTEMLEHLADPHAFTRQIGAHCRAIVASSPAWETSNMHYEFHAWAWDMEGYRALIEQAGFTVTRHEIAGGGYQVISGIREAA